MKNLSSLVFPCLVLFATGTANAAVLEDFQFNDPLFTLLGSAANSANPGNNWNEDVADMTNSNVQGGLYVIKKNNDNFGTNFLDIANVTSSKIWLVVETGSWHFSSIVGPAEFDAAEPEEIRFDFLDNDGNNQGGSTVTAEMEIERVANGGIVIQGTALGGGGSITAQPLPLTNTSLFTMVLALDKAANTYEIFTKVGAGSFTSIGPAAAVSPTRNANSVRFVANNNFGGTGEHFHIDRIYITNHNPIPEPASIALVGVGLAGFLFRRQRG